MADQPQRGVGKCTNAHLGSFGYPTRPEESYPFCPKCGEGMVWKCPRCDRNLPEDTEELTTARFCRYCGASYFDDDAVHRPLKDAGLVE